MKKQNEKQIDWNKQMVDTINALVLIADEHNIPRDTVVDALKDAIIKAYTKEYPETIVEVNIDIDNKHLSINRVLKVVEPYEDLNDYTEIPIEDAKKQNPQVQIGDTLKESVHLSELSNLSLGLYLSQMFKHNVTSEANRQVFNTWKPRIGEIIYAEVEKFDAKSSVATVNLGSTFGYVGRNESIPNEKLTPGQKYNFLIKDVKEQTKGWPIILSRSDPGLVKYLLTLNIPEIQENIIEIKDIARVAGFKTKLSVVSHQISVEAAGTVIGPRGSRIKTIQDQIYGEHIEVIEYDEDFKRYIVNVCAPAEIIGFAIKEPTAPEERREITLVANSEKLALLIGKRGSNVRLISEMLKANIEIDTVEEAHEEGLKYERVDAKQLRQQPFARAYSKYHVGRDVLSQYNKTKPINIFHQNQKKAKSSVLDDFKGMNKDELLKELSVVDTDHLDDNIDEDSE